MRFFKFMLVFNTFCQLYSNLNTFKSQKSHLGILTFLKLLNVIDPPSPNLKKSADSTLS